MVLAPRGRSPPRQASKISRTSPKSKPQCSQKRLSSEAIAAWADQPLQGEIDRATFRAWQALPFALAKLAEHDPRAVARLSARLENEDAPRWTFRHHRGERLRKLRRKAAADCLAETDHPDSDAALGRAAGRVTDPGLRAHIEQARERRRARRDRAREAGRGRPR